MAKIRHLIAIVSAASIFGTVYAYGEVRVLKQYTNYTYAMYDHTDNMWDDEYRSDVSVRGIDRIRNGTSQKYPQRIWITYDVQGDITVVSQSSNSRYDSVQRRNRKVVYDKWNFGNVTTAVWDATLLQVDGEVITPIGHLQENAD